MRKLKPIVTDIYDLPTLIGSGYVYVDKTALLRRMVSGVDGRFFFISRPRRFGKSLMLSTLEQMFKGRKALFRGLDIAKSDYDWKARPILRLDMSQIRAADFSGYVRALCTVLSVRAAACGVDLPLGDNPGLMLGQLLSAMTASGQKVAVLIDEYDAPIGGLINNHELLESVRLLLHDFYLALKVHADDIHFLMMTGVSKFTKLSVFSGMNNLTDLSMSPVYASLLGYTRDEVERVFASHVKAFAEKLGKTPASVVSDLLALFMKMAGASINAEVESANGRADAVLETEKSVFIFEFKYGKSVKAALKQCHDRDYAAPYANDGRAVIYVGVNYDTLKRNVDTLNGTLNDTLNDTLNARVLTMIRQRPGLRRPELMFALGVSESTVARALRTLRSQVEFRGAPKVGGYFVKSDKCRTKK